MVVHRAFFFFNDTAATEIYTLSLHDALPICMRLLNGTTSVVPSLPEVSHRRWCPPGHDGMSARILPRSRDRRITDRKSTRLNSSHANISYAVFCLKKSTDLKAIRLNDRVADL